MLRLAHPICKQGKKVEFEALLGPTPCSQKPQLKMCLNLSSNKIKIDNSKYN